MPKLLFRGAFIRFVDLRYDEKSKTPYLKINFTASFSEPIREAMEWGEPPAGYGSSDLDGEFAASQFVLTPNGRELKPSEIQMAAKSIGGFELHRVKGDEGDTPHYELRFQVVTPDVDGAAKLQNYIGIIGKGEAQLRVNYDVQSELEMEAEAAEEDTGDSVDDSGEAAGSRRGSRAKSRSPELVT